MILIAIAIKISNLLILFCSFELSYPILERDIFTIDLYIVLLNSVLFNLVCFASYCESHLITSAKTEI